MQIQALQIEVTSYNSSQRMVLWQRQEKNERGSLKKKKWRADTLHHSAKNMPMVAAEDRENKQETGSGKEKRGERGQNTLKEYRTDSKQQKLACMEKNMQDISSLFPMKDLTERQAE